MRSQTPHLPVVDSGRGHHVKNSLTLVQDTGGGTARTTTTALLNTFGRLQISNVKGLESGINAGIGYQEQRYSNVCGRGKSRG